ncbi:hypothetical protein LCGC14_2954350, partial [marine sediment metagenome]
MALLQGALSLSPQMEADDGYVDQQRRTCLAFAWILQ